MPHSMQKYFINCMYWQYLGTRKNIIILIASVNQLLENRKCRPNHLVMSHFNLCLILWHIEFNFERLFLLLYFSKNDNMSIFQNYFNGFILKLNHLIIYFLNNLKFQSEVWIWNSLPHNYYFRYHMNIPKMFYEWARGY